MNKTELRIGDIVHYVQNGDHLAAIITGFPLPKEEGQVFLTVFCPNAPAFGVIASEGGLIGPSTWRHGTWHRIGEASAE